MITLTDDITCPALPGFIADFFGFHAGLVGRQDLTEDGAVILAQWRGEEHSVFTILEDAVPVGFVHLQKLGPIVVELADLYVVPARRGQGIGTAAIGLAEDLAKQMPGIEAMTLQVMTRNEAALRLYHKLGYDTMSLVTLRKEFGENPRTGTADFAGLCFHI